MTVRGEKYKKLTGDANRKTPFNSPVEPKIEINRDGTLKTRIIIDFVKLNSVEVKPSSLDDRVQFICK